MSKLYLYAVQNITTLFKNLEIFPPTFLGFYLSYIIQSVSFYIGNFLSIRAKLLTKYSFLYTPENVSLLNQ